MEHMTTNRRLVGLVLFLGAVLIGLLVATALIGNSPAGSQPATQTPSAVASPSSTTGPTETPSASPTIPPTASISPLPTESATPIAPPGPQAAITFTQLKLDAKANPAGQDRVITFQTQGSGTIAVKFSLLSPRGTSQVCLISGSTTVGCRSAASGTLTATTTAAVGAFGITLRGVGTFTPTVEIAVTFPAATPTVTIANARFDGTAFPETNGIQALVTPRADGAVHVVAQWGGHPFLYEIDLIEQGGPGMETLADRGPSTNTDAALPVTGTNPWKLVLQNIQTGFGTTTLNATINWP